MGQYNMDYPAYAAMARGEDAIEGPKSFAEKRKLEWRGRYAVRLKTDKNPFPPKAA